LLGPEADFGTLPGICYAGGMTSFLFQRKIKIFDYPKFAEPFRNRIRENAEKMAAEAGIEIEFIREGFPHSRRGFECHRQFPPAGRPSQILRVA
jgi:hypothetical protein